MAKTPRLSLKELADQLTKRKYLRTPDSSIARSPPHHEFDAWTEAVQEQLLDTLWYYLKCYPDDVSRAFQKRLRVKVVVPPQRDPQPHYDPLPDKVFFALIEHDIKWLADPVIQCQIKGWQRTLKASSRNHAALRKKLKCIGECLVPVEVRGAGNFRRTEEEVRKMYFGVEGAEWREEDPETGTVKTWRDKSVGLYAWFKELERRYTDLPGSERNPRIRISTLLDKLVEDPKWKQVLFPEVYDVWTARLDKFARANSPLTPEQRERRERENNEFWTRALTPEQREKALALLKQWLPRRGRSASTIACKYIAHKMGLAVQTVRSVVKQGKGKK